MDKFTGILHATPEKRYKNFISTVVDTENVWMLSNQQGFATIDKEDSIYLLVWPAQEYAKYFSKEENDKPTAIEIHDFCDRCREICKDTNIKFMVFPTDENSFVINTEYLLYDIEEELDRVE